MVSVLLSGRTDIDQYFEISGIFEEKHLSHTPFLVFEIAGETVRVQIVYNTQELLAFPDETPVMGQWRGHWRSDFFQFKVGQYRQFLKAKDGE
jgi:hypothetical protein